LAIQKKPRPDTLRLKRLGGSPDLIATFKLSILLTLIVDNDLSALDGNDGRPGYAPLLDGLEAKTLKPSGLAVDQFGDSAGVARVAMFRFPRASQFDHAA
jgi:hypothetical protein